MSRWAIVFAVFFTVIGNSYAQTLSTVAGIYLGDDFPMEHAILKGPMGFHIDPSGNIYIADTDNHRIRKIDAETGIITTIAGNGNKDFSGDGGLAINASLYAPYDVCLDSHGNIYIVDCNNNRIRKIDAETGIISTIAGNGKGGEQGHSGDGGSALNARMSPIDISIDRDDNIYVVDQGSHRVRKIDGTTGIITNFAGNGLDASLGDGGPATNASLSLNPFSEVYIAPSGNVFIVENSSRRVRKIDGTTGIIRPFTKSL